MDKPLRVLLVEDSEDDALLLLHQLRRGGYEPIYERVDTPEEMERALRVADERDEPWDIVISDYFMPRFSGSDALTLLKRLGYEDMPFIVVSGKAGEETAVEMMRAGAQDYITKENMARLNPAIERELGEARARKSAEAALLRTENRFRRLVEQAADAMFVHDLEGRFVDVNRRACESLGYTREELLRMSVPDIEAHYTPGSLEKLWEAVSSGPPRTFEGLHRCKDGTTFPVEVHLGMFEADGRPLMLATARDITERKRAETVLRESEERFRATFEQAAVGISHVSPDGRWLRVNQKLCEIVGYDREGLLGMSFRDITHPDDLGRDLEHVRRMLDGETDTYSVEKRYVRKDGTIVWIELTTSLLRDPSGEPKYFISVTEDITPRKQAEASLRESEELYRTVVAQAAENIFLVDVESKRILDCNAALLDSLGYTNEEIRQMTLYDLIAHDRESVDENIRRILQKGRHFIGERQYRRKDGSRVDVEASVSVVSLGDRRAMCIVAHDVTERKRSEEALRLSEERYRAVVEQAGEGIFLFNAETKRIVETNPAFRQMFGYTQEELARMKLYDLVPDDPKGVDRNVERALEQGHLLVGERSYRRKDGSTIDVEVSGGVISYGGKGIICSIVRDITERKRTERASQEIREAERNRIARDLHDGVLQDLAYASAEVQVVRAISEEREAGTRLDRIVEALQRAGRELRGAVYNLRSGEEHDRPLPRLLESLVEQCRKMTPGCDIHLEVEEGFPAVSLGKRGAEVLRILQEALTNARRHSGAAHILVALRMESGKLVAEVSDEGRGFRPDTAMGVGLKSMEERAATLGADLEVESEPGKGTRVRLRSPL